MTLGERAERVIGNVERSTALSMVAKHILRTEIVKELASAVSEGAATASDVTRDLYGLRDG